MKKLVIYIHGKGGSTEEAKHYEPYFPGCDLIGWDYKSQNAMEAEEEFSELFDLCSKGYRSVSLIANSIGAFYAMCALSGKNIDRAWFISPIVDMEKLIGNMMQLSGITEEELKDKKEILTVSGEVLSMEYLCYVRRHPIRWNIPTNILYGGKDGLTSRDTVSEFADRCGATLTVMEEGEHWFHTEEQMKFLDRWIDNSIHSAKDIVDL